MFSSLTPIPLLSTNLSADHCPCRLLVGAKYIENLEAAKEIPRNGNKAILIDLVVSLRILRQLVIGFGDVGSDLDTTIESAHGNFSSIGLAIIDHRLGIE